MSPSTELANTLAALDGEIDQCLAGDRAGLRRRLRGLQRRLRERKPIDRGLGALVEAVRTSATRRQSRVSSRPAIEYPLELPVVARREEIAATIRDHPVVIVCGETGSGKTTQLPKICLELGRGIDGLIGHTQPRRIAARSVAARLAEELGGEIGQHVGFKIRFSDHTRPTGYVKLMTDGILLAEIQQDRLLSRYDTLIIDEAHERSLNIDFLLGYLKQLLPRRPDLKLIITSATIDPERFSRHFDDAPIVEVSGRTYPVDIRYRPLVGEDEDSRDLTLLEGIVQAADELAGEGPGDILVFLSGEREIREAAEALRKHHPGHTEILPLYARLSATEQQRVFQSHRGRRIVLATNVAETSLTVPGIRYVIDTGRARISRYSWRSKIQRLPIEAVSQASANQRAGRCGRVSEGVCIRLYDEQDFERRDAFTEPEILRTNLASVILQMEALGLGDIEAFPFVEPPDPRLIKDGYRLLHELGAVDQRNRITALGRRIARLPVDPRLARMLIAAEGQGCLRETLIVVSALAVQDPRERPLEHQQAADQAHARFLDERSDFLAYLNLWEYYQVQRLHLSKSKLRRQCRDEFLSFMRIREWIETHGQLRTLMLESGARENEKDASYAQLHRALLSGLLSHIGIRDEAGEFIGARNRRFRVFPGSGLFKRPPKWLMAAEIAETARVYARTCARIEPEWLEGLARPLMRREVFEPHWQRRAGRAGAYERLSLYGLVVVAKRRIDYTRINPVESRELLIRHALVYGEYKGEPTFLKHNLALVDEVEELEARSRRRDILVDEDSLYAFYDRLLPETITNLAAFERWRAEVEREDPKALFFRREALMRHEAEDITAERFPDTIQVGGLRLPLTYRFEPEAEDDGVSVTVPAAALNQLDRAPFDWLVPGLFEERLVALIRGLPKALRKNFVPAPDFARALAQRLPYRDGGLFERMNGE
ncbi:MAG: ATP-dependent RNA helicase HrpA, partial [Chromatiales bacterium]